MATASRLDKIYRSFLITKIFTKGWGNPRDLKRLYKFRAQLANKAQCAKLIDTDYPVVIDKVHNYQTEQILEGHMLSPVVHHLPSVVPQEVQTARFQLLLPNNWTGPSKPVVIHLAGTGDHGFSRRRSLVARPLLHSHGIGSLILENPFYGCRKPKSQTRSSLHHVTDLFVMGACLNLECHVLLHWLRNQGFGPLGLTGISMGGHMACLAACNWPEPVALIPCLSGQTASAVFTQGVLSGAIPWKRLASQFLADDVYLSEIGPLLSKHRRDNISNEKHILTPRTKEYLTSKASVDEQKSRITRTSSRTTSKLKREVNVKKQRTDLQHEAIDFMKAIMTEFTFVGNYGTPVDTELIYFVTATQDAYVPQENTSLEEFWPGCEVRYVDAGHIAAFLFHQDIFRKSIVDSFTRMSQKYTCESLQDVRQNVLSNSSTKSNDLMLS